MRQHAAILIAIFVGTVSAAQTPPKATASRTENFGAVAAPATLPTGASSMYGYVGAPEVGVGFRQGFGRVELEARGAFNYFLLAFSVDAIAKIYVFRHHSLEVAPLVGLGLVYDTGSRYFDTANFEHLALRPRAGVVASIPFSETVKGVGLIEVPWAISVAPGNGSHIVPLAGGGAEIYMGSDLSVLVLGQLGVDAIKEPLGTTQVRLGYGLKLGLGMRLF